MLREHCCPVESGMPAPLILRVFLSSPGDVVEERKLARQTLEALEGSHLLKGEENNPKLWSQWSLIRSPPSWPFNRYWLL